MNYVIYDLETNGINVLDNSIMQMTMLSKMNFIGCLKIRFIFFYFFIF